MAEPGQPRLPRVHDHEADRHGDRDIDEADHDQPGSLAERETGANEGVENREEDERNSERLEQQNDQHAQPAEVLVAQAAQVWILAEGDSECRPADHGDDHLGIKRQAQAEAFGLLYWYLRFVGAGQRGSF